MIIIETFARGCQPNHHPAPAAAAVESRAGESLGLALTGKRRLVTAHPQLGH
jgi:hypothetical protein